jgi:hypothetical protein
MPRKLTNTFDNARQVLFSAYSAAFAACKDSRLADPLPLTGGLKPAVVVGAVASAGTLSY